MKKENKFQPDVIKALRERFKGCFITKLDSKHIQGIPDLLMLWNNHWAVLEVKKSNKEPYQPNQEDYIAMLNDMSFSAMICPENKEDVLDAIQRTFQTKG